MKNLKKVLSLVLVIALAFSFMSIGSAAFTDEADIKYKEAVGVMTGIGAINGYTDGSFKPAGLVTRAEAAKMIAYAILGPTVAAALGTSTSSFTDVPATHWASPFIEYCVTQGIINGRGDGTFDPNGNVTGFEIAKMMLCAAGYGKNDEYVGPNWQINVAKDAMQNKIFKGNETGNFAAPATREEAALYIFNGIYRVGQVEYNELFGYYGKGGSALAPASSGDPIATEVYNMKNEKGIVVSGSVTSATTTGTNVAVAELDDDGKVDELAAPKNFKFDATKDDMGHLLSIYYNTVTGKVFYTEKLSTTVSVIFATSTPNGFFNAFGSLTTTTADEFYTFAQNYTSPAEATVLSGFTSGTVAIAGDYALYGGEIISHVSSVSKTFDKVTAINKTLGAESISFYSGLILSNKTANDVVKEYDDIAVDDYVVLSKIGDMYSVEKCTTVDAKISKIDYFAGIMWTITADGKDYGVSSASGTADLDEKFPEVKTDYNTNVYTLYLDAEGKVVSSVLKEGTSLSTVVYITGDSWVSYADYGNVNKVQAVNSAGEQVIYNLGSSSFSGSGFKKVTVNATTGIAAITDPDLDPTTLADQVAESGATALGGIKKTDIVNKNDGTNIFYYGADVTFIFVSGTGADLKITKVTGLANVAGVDLTNSSMLYFNKTTSPNKTVHTVIVPGVFTGGTDAKVMYVYSSSARVGSSDKGFIWTVYMDGVRENLTFSHDDLAQYSKKFVSYTVNSDGIYTITGTSVPNTALNAVIPKNGIYGNNVTIGGVTRSAAGAPIVDRSVPSGDPAMYPNLASMQAANKNFVVNYSWNNENVITAIFIMQAYEYSAAPLPAIATTNGVSATLYSITYDGTVATYTINVKGIATADTVIQLTNGVLGPQSGWTAQRVIRVSEGGDGTTVTMNRFDDTRITILDRTYTGGGGGTNIQFTVQLTADDTPAPTVVIRNHSGDSSNP